MKTKNKNDKILHMLSKELSFCDIIIMKIFKGYTCKVYRIGLNHEYNWENQKMGKI